MPNMNKTGPQGAGPKTGRGMGPCGNGLRQGRGTGAGFGFRRFFSPKNDLATLENDEKMLEEELARVKEEKDALKKEQ